MKHPIVRKVLGRARLERASDLKIRGDRVLEELAYCALRDPIDMCDENGQLIVDDLTQIPEPMRRAIENLEVTKHFNLDTGEEVTKMRLTFVNKGNSLKLLMQHLGMLDEVHHHQHTNVSVYSNADPEALLAAKSALDTVVASCKPVAEPQPPENT